MISESFIFVFMVSEGSKYVDFWLCVHCGATIAEPGHSVLSREQHMAAGCNPNKTTARLVAK